MKKIKRNNNNNFLSIVSALIVLAHLLIIFFVKYKIQNLPLDNFRLGYIGNLLNLSFSILIILGLVVNIFLKSRVSDRAILSYIVLAHLLIIFFVKYKIQNLPLDNFRLGYIGNLLNLSFSI